MSKALNTGLIAISAKPFHSGHFDLIEQASMACDNVIVYVSLVDRTSHDFTVTGLQMSKIWLEHIITALPKNVDVVFVKNPFQSVIANLQASLHNTRFHVYCGADRAEKYAKKHLPHDIQQFSLKIIDRTNNKSSGSACRAALAAGRFDDFRAQMPLWMNVTDVWNILKS